MSSAQGIRGSVHIQVGAEDGLAEANWVQWVAETNPDWPLVKVVFCDLTAPGLAATLDVYQSLPCIRGVRQIVGRAPGEDALSGTNDLLDAPTFVAGLQEVGRRGLSFDLQLIPDLMEKTARVLEQAPNTPVALCHAGSPHDRTPRGITSWARRIQMLADLPQVTCKLSGLGMFDHGWTTETIRPIVETWLEQFGADRVMFGSNFPVDKLCSDYSTLVQAYRDLIPRGTQKAVFGQTAARFYSMPIPGAGP